MVGKEFIDLFKSFQVGSNLAVDDFADRLNLFTVLIFLICCIFISTKQYVFNSISCYIPVEPSGAAFKDYLSNYCWVHGTIPLRLDEKMPSTPDEWNLYDKYRRISKPCFVLICDRILIAICYIADWPLHLLPFISVYTCIYIYGLVISCSSKKALLNESQILQQWQILP